MQILSFSIVVTLCISPPPLFLGPPPPPLSSASLPPPLPPPSSPLPPFLLPSSSTSLLHHWWVEFAALPWQLPWLSLPPAVLWWSSCRSWWTDRSPSPPQGRASGGEGCKNKPRRSQGGGGWINQRLDRRALLEGGVSWSWEGTVWVDWGEHPCSIGQDQVSMNTHLSKPTLPKPLASNQFCRSVIT